MYSIQISPMLVHCGVLQNHNNMKSPTEKLWVAASRQIYPTMHENMAFSQRIVTKIKGGLNEKGLLKRCSRLDIPMTVC